MRKRLRRPRYSTLIAPIGLTATSLFTMRSRLDDLVFAAVSLGLVWVLIGWPVLAAGVWVDDEGIRIRHFYHARRIPWSEISKFESMPARSTIPWMDSNFNGIWLIPKQGKPIEVGFVRRPAGSEFDYIRPLRGSSVDWVTFRGKLEELNGLLAQHRRRVGDHG